MPVQFKSGSNQRPHVSSSSLFTSAQQDAETIDVAEEPPLQHKKRIEGPPTSLSANYYDAKNDYSDEYALLGKHSKFASNVLYHLKDPHASLSDKEKFQAGDRNTNAKDVSPPKQMKLDSKKEQQKDSKGKENLVIRNVSEKVPARTEGPQITQSPLPAPRKPKDAGVEPLKAALKDKNLDDVLDDKPQKEKSIPAKSNKRQKVSTQYMNESVQTDMNKNIAISAPEAPADYALQYKAGIAPRHLSAKTSEYQKEFNWKQSIPTSPMLTAEQIVHKSNSHLSQNNVKSFPRKTEYQSKFQVWPLLEKVAFAPKSSNDILAPSKSGSREQMKRSKSVGALISPEDLPAAGSATVTSSDDPRLLRESGQGLPKPKPPIPYGRLKRPATEYRANFKSPTRFLYEHGAWKGASPPQLFQQKNGGSTNVTTSSPEKSEPQDEKEEKKKEIDASQSNWFAEVLELRRRANEYKRRAQGTHFSREHLLQLLAQQNEYWDLGSNDSVANLDALALEPGAAVHRLNQQRKKKENLRDQDEVIVDRFEPLPITEPLDKNQSARAYKGSGRKSRRSAWVEEKDQPVEKSDSQVQVGDGLLEPPEKTDDQELNARAGERGVDEADVEGRLPTPLLRQQKNAKIRHHLDLTTPSIGGILLSSPNQKKILTSRSGDSYVTISDEHLSPKITIPVEKMSTTPILGKPTSDTHALRDDDALSDHVLETHYVSSPSSSFISASKRSDRSVQRRSGHRLPGVPETIDERMGETYNLNRNFVADDLPIVQPLVHEDDVLSVSASSIASSSSLASQVYERALKRRDEFWGKPNEGTVRKPNRETKGKTSRG